MTNPKGASLPGAALRAEWERIRPPIQFPRDNDVVALVERLLAALESGEAQKRDGDAQDAGVGDRLTRAAAVNAEGCGDSVPPLEAAPVRAEAVAVQRAADHWLSHFSAPSDSFVGLMRTDEFIRAAQTLARVVLGAALEAGPSPAALQQLRADALRRNDWRAVSLCDALAAHIVKQGGVRGESLPPKYTLAEIEQAGEHFNVASAECTLPDGHEGHCNGVPPIE